MNPHSLGTAQTKFAVGDEPDSRSFLAVLSAPAYHQVLKLARTISDLAGEEKIAPPHLAEALQYRPKLGMM